MLTACVLLGCSVYGTEADQTKIPAQTTEEVQVPDENGENRDGRGNDYVQSATTEPETDIAIAETSEPIEKQYLWKAAPYITRYIMRLTWPIPLLTPGSGSWKKEKSP